MELLLQNIEKTYREEPDFLFLSNTFSLEKEL